MLTPVDVAILVAAAAAAVEADTRVSKAAVSVEVTTCRWALVSLQVRADAALTLVTAICPGPLAARGLFISAIGEEVLRTCDTHAGAPRVAWAARAADAVDARQGGAPVEILTDLVDLSVGAGTRAPPPADALHVLFN